MSAPRAEHRQLAEWLGELQLARETIARLQAEAEQASERFQRANGMAKAEAELAAAGWLRQPYVCSTERIGELFLACMRAGVVIYPDAVGFDSVRGVNFAAISALPPNETCAFYVENQSGLVVGEELELVMLRALAFVAAELKSMARPRSAPWPGFNEEWNPL